MVCPSRCPPQSTVFSCCFCLLPRLHGRTSEHQLRVCYRYISKTTCILFSVLNLFLCLNMSRDTSSSLVCFLFPCIYIYTYLALFPCVDTSVESRFLSNQNTTTTSGGHHLLHGHPMRHLPPSSLPVGPAPSGLAQLRGHQRCPGGRNSRRAQRAWRWCGRGEPKAKKRGSVYQMVGIIQLWIQIWGLPDAFKHIGIDEKRIWREHERICVLPYYDVHTPKAYI